MFGLPDAKRVRRSDLGPSRSASPSAASSSSSSSSQHEPSNAHVLARLNQSSLTLFSPALVRHPEQDPDPDSTHGLPDSFSFRLFGPSKPSESVPESTLPRIRLESPSAKDAPPGILRPRPAAYYQASALSDTARARIAATALDGDTVLAAAAKPCPGLSCPWRVAHVPAQGSAVFTTRHRANEVVMTVGQQLRTSMTPNARVLAEAAAAAAPERTKKGRVGKKARTKLRIKARQDARRKGQQEALEQQRKERDERVLEKKRAQNRKKQHKKRQKGREKAETLE